MKLADLKKFAIRQHTRIRFPLPGGLECVVDEHGVAQTPGLDRVPDFNLEDALAKADMFTLDPAGPAKKRPPASRVSAAQLAALAAAGGPGQSHHDEHDE